MDCCSTFDTNSRTGRLVNLQTDIDLQPYNTLAVPARGAYYAEVTEREQLPELLRFARDEALPLLVLGGGSNIVLERDFPGLVLHIRLTGKTLLTEDRHHYWLKVAAGENWHELVQFTLEHGYWGLENLSLIPGSVGAAPIQNIGAYGVELKDVFERLEAVDVASGELVEFNADECAFGYRDSLFKRGGRDRYIIVSVTLRLLRQPHLKVTYPSLREALQSIPVEALTPKDVGRAVCTVRQSKLPDPMTIPNVGSFFKNPLVGLDQFMELQMRHPGLVSYPIDARHVKLAAGWLIERAGWKGVQRGSVAVHSEQALVLTNPGRASGAEVLALAEEIRHSIAAEYGVDLEAEPRVYP